ncbi:MAG: hypothetical protein RSE39_00830 [Oscillospiraceae bacterium]
MRKKAISFLLCTCMALTAFTPRANVIASDGSDATPSSPRKTAQGITLNKTASRNADGTYKISMEAYTTGKVNPVPNDIVLVIDESGSMSDRDFSKTIVERCKASDNNSNLYRIGDMLFVVENSARYPVKIEKKYNVGKVRYEYTYSYTDSNNVPHTAESYRPNGTPPSWNFYHIYEDYISRTQAVQEAVAQFCATVTQDAVENSVNHRIAMVGFSTDYLCEMITGPGAGKKYENMKPEYYQNALRDVTQPGTQSELTNAIRTLKGDGATRTDIGMDMAKNIFANDALGGSSNRNRVVVVLSDGVPERAVDIGFNKNLANDALAYSHDIKSGSNAKVFDVSIFSEADINGTDKANSFMNYLSSNYPDAINMDNAGTKTSGDYYLIARDQTGLNGLFGQIATMVTKPDISLGQNTVVKDTISENFKLPNGATAADINVYTQNFNGNGIWDSNKTKASGVTPTISGKQTGVSGFDFDANCITQVAKPDGTFGKKLIIEFNVELDGTSFGGNGIPTDTTQSGVYAGNNLIANFPVTTVDAPVNYRFDTSNQLIYASNNADLGLLLKDATGFAPNGKNNAFVDISFLLKQGSTEIGTFKINAGADKGLWAKGSDNLNPLLTKTSEYSIECTVTPKTAGVEQAKNYEKKIVKVVVLKPYISTKDKKANYNDEINLDSNVSAEWKTTEITDGLVPLGSTPKLSYEFEDSDGAVATPKAYKVLKDSRVRIKGVTANGTDLMSITTFNPATKDFTIGINKFNLVINKTVEGTKKIDQVFIIAVKDSQGNVFNVTILPSDFKDGRTATKKMNGLYCGMDYKISEDKNWSWRYAPEILQPTINVTEDGKIETVNIKNSRINDKWLCGEAVSSNAFIEKYNPIANLFNNDVEG